ncbi:helix-turn-helix domain-containing protein [Nocardioides jejuensis]|uniref:Helix-turn-helix domain-containing protein n=1 Tax=Nocardioides jejuensis TaxID=2502782 RepID=A0A4R1C1L6_9ACTN|nr:helix-turn-helix domain-containing protein [Nocardioides jejuensis]TCJ23616.1 helix-turn-helix domain-containing protein [Nocardioides jejuensis]
MGHFHPDDVVEEALRLLRAGVRPGDVAARTGVPRNTVWRWRKVYLHEGLPRGQSHCQVPCPRCDGAALDEDAYAELLGWYLGDGHIVRARRGVWKFSIYNDANYADDNARLVETIGRLKPGSTPMALARRGMVTTYLYWKHWPCLFPQHGPGYKHTRPIVLDRWQREVVERRPGPFLRGLFHSDGCRTNNWASRIVNGERKRYDYPRWQFSNRSDDIRDLCCWALDLLEIPWRQSNTWCISVSRREAVARLDALIGLKS